MTTIEKKINHTINSTADAAMGVGEGAADLMRDRTDKNKELGHDETDGAKDLPNADGGKSKAAVRRIG